MAKLNNDQLDDIAQSKVTDLVADLAGKAATAHTHVATDVTDFDTEVANNSAVAANTAKTGITTAQADEITANTAKVTYPSADSTKVGYISITQAVDLDTLESDVATNTAKVGVTDETNDDTVNAHKLDTSNPHAVTAVQAGAEPTKGADDNYVTDAEKIVIGNTSGTNTGDMSNSDVKTAYEANLDTNAFTDAEKTLLGNQSGTNTGDQDISGKQDKLAEGAFVDGDKTKLDGIEAGAQVNTAHTPEGTAIKSTGELGGSKFLREDGAGGAGWVTIAGGGDLLSTNNLSDLADAATARTNLGVDASGTDNSTNVTLSGTGTYLTLTGQDIQVDPITESDISDLTHDIAQATTLAAGKVELATIAEVDAGTDTSRAITPSRLAGSALQTKVDGIESGATADQSNAEIKTAYEANSNTNAFTDANQTKLSGIETAADVTDATNVTAAGAVMDSELINTSAGVADAGKPIKLDASGVLSTTMYTDTTDHTALSNIGTKSHATLDTEVAANTLKNTYPSADSTKVGFISVTQAVDLDTMESDIATNNAKTGVTTEISNVVEDTTPQLGGNLDTQTFTVDGRDVGTDGATLDSHVADVSNPHTVTAAQVGADPAGTDNSTDVSLAGTGTYLSLVGQVLTQDPLTASDVTDFDTEVGNHADVVANTAKISFDSASSTKLSGIEALADVTDNTNVSATTSVSSNTTHRTTTTGNPHSVTASDVGLGNVDNTSDATKNSATATLTNKTIDADNNTITNIGNAEVSSGVVVQRKSAGYSAVATGTGTFSGGSTNTPTNTDGDQYMSLAITPKSTSNILVIEAMLMMTTDSADHYLAALFQDSTSAALAVGWVYQNVNTAAVQVFVRHTMAAGTTSATTFKIRAGGTTAGTTTFNGQSSASRWGTGTTKSILTITEYKA